MQSVADGQDCAPVSAPAVMKAHRCTGKQRQSDVRLPDAPSEAMIALAVLPQAGHDDRRHTGSIRRGVLLKGGHQTPARRH